MDSSMSSSSKVMELSIKTIDAMRELAIETGITNQAMLAQFARDRVAILGLGFEGCNVKTTGWDGQRSSDDLYIESKTVSCTSKVYNITCEDTSRRKACKFGVGNVAIALTVFGYDLLPMFSVVGNNPEIWQELFNKSEKKRKAGKRENVTISMNNLIKKYDFKIVVR